MGKSNKQTNRQKYRRETKITILCPGRLKERYLADAQGCLGNIIRKNHTLDIVELPEEKAPANISAAHRAQILLKEADGILSRLAKAAASSEGQTLVIALAIDGQQLTTAAIRQRLTAADNIIFIIGGSLGLSDSVLTKADIRLSFSGLTFPHQLMRIILLEALATILL